jgi:hypothetical protein
VIRTRSGGSERAMTRDSYVRRGYSGTLLARLLRVIFRADGHDSCCIQTEISTAAARLLPLNFPFSFAGQSPHYPSSLSRYGKNSLIKFILAKRRMSDTGAMVVIRATKADPTKVMRPSCVCQKHLFALVYLDIADVYSVRN